MDGTNKDNPEVWLPYVIRSGKTDRVVEVLRDNPRLLSARFSGNTTPLLEAAYSGHYELADSLLEMGAKMDFVAAVALDRFETVRAMLNETPSLVHRHSPDRWSAIHIAAWLAGREMMSLLIWAGADVNDNFNTKGKTPLFFAWKRPYNNAEMLLTCGADVNARAKHGFTVLHYAAWSGESAFVEFLLAHGANSKLQTDGRQTAWALAVRHGHRAVAALLYSR